MFRVGAIDIQKIKEEAGELIIAAVNFASIAGMTASDWGIDLSTSLYLNIRDAMFHYKALCDFEERDYEMVLKHYFNLEEHLLRGEKDAVIFQAQAVCDAVFDVIQLRVSVECFSTEEIKRLRVYVHKLKDVILSVRTAGTNLAGGKGFSVMEAWNNVAEYTMKIFQMYREKGIPLF